jgi:hypothetical protein
MGMQSTNLTTPQRHRASKTPLAAHTNKHITTTRTGIGRNLNLDLNLRIVTSVVKLNNPQKIEWGTSQHNTQMHPQEDIESTNLTTRTTRTTQAHHTPHPTTQAHHTPRLRLNRSRRNGLTDLRTQ